MTDDGLNDEPEFPRKWLDKKEYVRVDTSSGLPQLVRVEPIMSDDGGFVADTVKVFIDDRVEMVMTREAAEEYVESLGCVPLATTAQYKHRLEH